MLSCYHRVTQFQIHCSLMPVYLILIYSLLHLWHLRCNFSENFLKFITSIWIHWKHYLPFPTLWHDLRSIAYQVPVNRILQFILTHTGQVCKFVTICFIYTCYRNGKLNHVMLALSTPYHKINLSIFEKIKPECLRKHHLCQSLIGNILWFN